MKGYPATQPQIKYLLCDGPFKDVDATHFLVEIHPARVLNGRKIRFSIPGSTFPDSYPPHQLAWAIGNRVLSLLRDPAFRASRPASENPFQVEEGFKVQRAKATEEIETEISSAPRSSEALQVLRCQNKRCRKLLFLPNGRLGPGGKPPYHDPWIVSGKCKSCGQQISRRASELLLCVRPLQASR